MELDRRQFIATAAASAATLRAADAAAGRKAPSKSKRLGLPEQSSIKAADPAEVVANPRGLPDPTNTDAKHLALQVVPTLSNEPA